MGVATSRSAFGDSQADESNEDDLLSNFLNRFGLEMDVAPCMTQALHNDPRAAERHKHMYQNHMLMGLTAAWAARSVANSVISEQREIAARLAALHREEVEFSQVEIYREPLDSRVADHHVLVYWYESPHNMGTAGFRLDWGVTGLFHRDCLDMPQQSLLASKECGLAPRTLAEQLLRLRGKEYGVVHFNCQHFCSLLLDQAGGNARLGNELDRLERAHVHLTCTALYWQDERWTLVYWHQDPRSSADRGLQIKWNEEGLSFLMLWSEPHGVCVRRRGCATRPAVLRQQLRSVEGRSYQAREWNDWHLMQWLYGRVLAKGGIMALHERLEELGQKSAEIAGVIEALVEAVPGDHVENGSDDEQHVLIYTYRARNQHAVHLWLIFNSRGISFSEADEEPQDTAVLRMKPMMFECLQPQVLQQQLQVIQDTSFDADVWNSKHFCERLFSQAPGSVMPGSMASASTNSVQKHPSSVVPRRRTLPVNGAEESSAKPSEKCDQAEELSSELKNENCSLPEISWKELQDTRSRRLPEISWRELQETSRRGGVLDEVVASSASSNSTWLGNLMGEVQQSSGSEDSFETEAQGSEKTCSNRSKSQSAQRGCQEKAKVAKPGRELAALGEALIAHRAAVGQGSTVSSTSSSTAASPRSVSSDCGGGASKAEQPVYS